MIGYGTLGTNDKEKAAKFYDALMAEAGAKRVLEGDTFIAWGTDMQSPSLGVITPFDGQSATVGNGVMVALAMPSKEMVNKMYEKAIELGATCEGKPGPRAMEGFYAAYFRDPDGNKLNCFCMG